MFAKCSCGMNGGKCDAEGTVTTPDKAVPTVWDVMTAPWIDTGYGSEGST